MGKKQANLKGLLAPPELNSLLYSRIARFLIACFQHKCLSCFKKTPPLLQLSLTRKEWGPQTLHRWGAHKCESKVLLCVAQCEKKQWQVQTKEVSKGGSPVCPEPLRASLLTGLETTHSDHSVQVFKVARCYQLFPCGHHSHIKSCWLRNREAGQSMDQHRSAAFSSTRDVRAPLLSRSDTPPHN